MGWLAEDGTRSVRRLAWTPEFRAFVVRSDTGGQFALAEQFSRMASHPRWSARERRALERRVFRPSERRPASIGSNFAFTPLACVWARW